MNIAQLKEMPIGYKTGGFNLAVKTPKKTTTVNGQMFHNVCFMDATGEIFGDVKLIKHPVPVGWEGKAGHYNPLMRDQEIRIIVCEIQESENALHTKAGKCGKKLMIHEYSINDLVGKFANTEEFMDWDARNEKIVRSKIRCWLVAATIQNNATMQPNENSKNWINAWVDFVMTGE